MLWACICFRLGSVEVWVRVIILKPSRQHCVTGVCCAECSMNNWIAAHCATTHTQTPKVEEADYSSIIRVAGCAEHVISTTEPLRTRRPPHFLNKKKETPTNLEGRLLLWNLNKSLWQSGVYGVQVSGLLPDRWAQTYVTCPLVWGTVSDRYWGLLLLRAQRILGWGLYFFPVKRDESVCLVLVV